MATPPKREQLKEKEGFNYIVTCLSPNMCQLFVNRLKKPSSPWWPTVFEQLHYGTQRSKALWVRMLDKYFKNHCVFSN